MDTTLPLDGISLDDRKLIVGIDFGTTYTGIAWAESRKPDQQTIVNVWPSDLDTREGKTMDKVPTEVRYTPEGMEWGFQIPSTESMGSHKWFKLSLAQPTKSDQSRSPEELSGDYLTAIHDHLMYTLEQKLGAATLHTISIEYCLTVPAMWPEPAKEKTLAAAKRAGLNSDGDIFLVSEPEAAAIYALGGLDPRDLKIGDSFVLCDAGGGTVDLISYQITQLSPVINIMEIAPGTGGLCGSTFLNRRFSDFLTNKLGKEEGWDAELLADAIDRFDLVIKKQYSPSKSRQSGYTILVPGLANNEQLGIRRGRLLVTSGEMREIFEDVVLEVIKLVQGQIKTAGTPIKAVLLVGGFGESNYLKERLRSDLGSSVEVIQPPNAWTAIVRGAVTMGLSRADAGLTTVGVVSRSARKHYGIQLNTDFVSHEHEESKKYWCKKHARFRVPAMHWFIEKGEAIVEGQPRKITFGEHYLVDKGVPVSHTTEILCDEKSLDAPIHRNSNVRSLVSLRANFQGLSKKDLEGTKVKRSDNQWYYYIEGYVEATYSSATTKYFLVLMDKRYDSVTAEYA